MKVQAFILLASAAVATAAATGSLADRGSAIEVPAELAKRGCKRNCECTRGIKAGLYCGNCDVKGYNAINQNKAWDHVYQCGSDGSCCDYGYAKDCGTKKARCASGKPNPLSS